MLIHGYTCYFTNSSYNCPALKLYGYSIERSLSLAILRSLKLKSRVTF